MWFWTRDLNWSRDVAETTECGNLFQSTTVFV